MKNVLLISLLLTHLLGNTELCQLLRVPKIFEHYQEHQLWNTDASFLGFITMHYMGKDGIDGDEDQDKELPFMHILHQTPLVSTAPPTVCSAVPKRINAELKTFTIRDNFNVRPVYTGTLLRPPRMSA